MKKIKSFLTAVIMIAVFLCPFSVQAETFKGIDVYEYDNISNYQQLKNNGIQVIIQKATEGLTYNDGLLQYRYKYILSNGFKIGFYHYARNNNPVVEANHFLSQINGLHSDTCLWLDIENEGDWNKQNAINYVNQFVSYVENKGYKVGIYTGLSFYYEYLQGNIPNNIPIWLASYGRQPKQFPSTVSWQYTDSGQPSGIIGNVDMDYFNDDIFTGQRTASTGSTSSQTSSDSNVASLQSQLNSLINANLAVDGIQGSKTTNAIERFQSIMGLKVDGIAGNQTLNAINQIRSYPADGVSYPHYGYATRWIQWRIGASIDGTYGNGTAKKVTKFQEYYGLIPDGITGSRTWPEMFK